MSKSLTFAIAFVAALLLFTVTAKADHFPQGTPFTASFFCEGVKTVKFYYSLPEDQLDPIPAYIDCWQLPYRHAFVVVKYIETTARRDGRHYEIYEAVSHDDLEGTKYYTINPVEKPAGRGA